MKSCLEQRSNNNAPSQQRVSTNDADVKVMKQLRTATQTAHQNLEHVDFNCRLASGTISASEYAALIEIHRLVHAALESVIRDHDNARVRAVWREHQAKVDLLERDRDQHPDDVSAFGRALGDAEAFADEIREHGPSHPDWLLGVFYVVEGSTLGGMFLRPRIAESLGCEPDDLHYYGAYGRDTKRRWMEFTERMNGALRRPAQIARCVQGGNDGFGAYRDIFEAMPAPAEVEAAS